MPRQKKIIISAAVTGAIHTPGMSPYLPVTPDEIIRQALDAHRAGAAIIHRAGRPWGRYFTGTGTKSL